MLEMINVSVTLDGENGPVEVLKDINLKLEPKKIYVMTGPNGGGKSSIAKTIMGIFPASTGQVWLDGQDITALGITERARLGISYAFQRPPVFKGMTVREFLSYAAGSAEKPELCDLLFDVGLCAQDYLDREINASFSGGELKRIEIASLLARDLKIALFDEPEAGIDLWSFRRLTETFENMNKKYDTTIVIISHQERILQLADHVILVAEGRISGITSRDSILSDIKRLDADCRCRQNCPWGGVSDADCN
ncbi:MAG: ATP-binding cassette domain-containing protein [Syntrophomonadaceae bacterium]